MQLVLASQSPYRRAQLENFGFLFRAESPRVNESELKSQGPHDLIELTRFLSLRKALSLKKEFPDGVIIGSDQIAELAGRRLDKPGTRAGAQLQLRQLSGQTHRLLTSLALVAPNSQQLIFTDVTTVRMKELSAQEIDSYLDCDQPYDCAGSYKIEKAGLALIDEIQTSDPSAIQGLPLMSLVRGLKEMGLKPSQFWSQR